MKRPSAREAIVTAVLLTLLGLVDCTGPTQNFSIVHINPDTLKVTFEGRLPQSPPRGLAFYQRRNAVNGFVILHFSPDETVDSPILFTDVASFVKTKSGLQVLIQGVYGTVYARTTYFYSPEYLHAPISFDAELSSNGTASGPVKMIGAVDRPGELSAITIVRVFRAPPEFMVVCATYGPDGHLFTLSVNGSKRGNWVHTNELLPLYKGIALGTSIGDRSTTREYFGLPKSFPTSDYLHEIQNVTKSVTLPNYLDVIYLHYQRNKYVRQDTFDQKGTSKTEFLQYAMPEAFPELTSLDDRMQFGK